MSPTTSSTTKTKGYFWTRRSCSNAFQPGVVPSVSLRKKVAAEFVCTFILVFCAVAGPIANQKYFPNDAGAASLLRSAACAGLAVTACVLSIGHISGAHLNPAVTVAFAAIRRFPWSHAPSYFAAQASGSLCAAFALKGAFRPFGSGGVTIPAVGTAQAFGMEVVATFVLMFVITAVATDSKAVGQMAGVAIGSAVLLDILVIGSATGASMNPVRTLGPAVAAGNYKQIWIYFVAPVVGAVVGAVVYNFVRLNDDERVASEPQV